MSQICNMLHITRPQAIIMSCSTGQTCFILPPSEGVKGICEIRFILCLGNNYLKKCQMKKRNYEI